MNKKDLELLLQKEFNISSKAIEQLDIYYNLLVETNKVINLTAITEEASVYIKHFYDSLLLSKLLPLSNEKLLDIGSGAGFPGLVLKICYPDLNITLLEPTLKRCNFLNKVITTLNLTNITVVNKRAEEYVKEKREYFDIVTARAVAPLNILLELSIPFVKINGNFISLKGSNLEEELNNSKNAIKELNVTTYQIANYTLPIDEGSRKIIKFNKNKQTKTIYPRIYSKIKNTPL